MNAFSRSAVTSSSFFSFSRWCESVEPAMPVSAWISSDDHAVGVCREEQAHDPQPGLGAEGGEHVGVADDRIAVAYPYFYKYRNKLSSPPLRRAMQRNVTNHIWKPGDRWDG